MEGGTTQGYTWEVSSKDDVSSQRNQLPITGDTGRVLQPLYYFISATIIGGLTLVSTTRVGTDG